MTAKFCWIEGLTHGRLAIMPKPSGGEHLDGEIKTFKEEGVEILVSLLTEEEIQNLQLEESPALCKKYKIKYLNFPITDHSTPEDDEEMREFLFGLDKLLKKKRSLLAHCFAGIGRSALVAGCLLILQDHCPKDAFRMISNARGLTVPDTRNQFLWAKRFAEIVAEQ